MTRRKRRFSTRDSVQSHPGTALFQSFSNENLPARHCAARGEWLFQQVPRVGIGFVQVPRRLDGARSACSERSRTLRQLMLSTTSMISESASQPFAAMRAIPMPYKRPGWTVTVVLRGEACINGTNSRSNARCPEPLTVIPNGKPIPKFIGEVGSLATRVRHEGKHKTNMPSQRVFRFTGPGCSTLMHARLGSSKCAMCGANIVAGKTKGRPPTPD